MIETALVSINQAFELLRQVHESSTSRSEDLMKELGRLKSKMLSLLIHSGAVSQDEISTAAGFCCGDSTDVLQALVQSETLPPQLMRDSARCVSLIENGKLRWKWQQR